MEYRSELSSSDKHLLVTPIVIKIDLNPSGIIRVRVLTLGILGITCLQFRNHIVRV